MRLEESSWSFSLFPDAAEGGGCLSVRRSGAVASGGPPNVERAAEEAARRARTRIRRYGAANRLNRLGTLTYRGSGCHDPRALRTDVGRFFRGLRDGLGGERFPYVWVPQWHPGGHGLHAHFAVGRFVPRSLIEQAWGHGFVHIKLLDGLPVGSGELAEARLAARYLAGYAARDLADERRPPGLHRYDVGQGFEPDKVECYGDSAERAIRNASRVMGSEPERIWLSSTVEGWRGPPACWAQWD